MNRDRLKKEPSGDLISREETLTAFADYVGSGMSMDDYDALWDIVAKMPAVNPQPCEDAISRQAAIFLADELKQNVPDDERMADMVMAHNEGILEYQTQLSLLPPVTPQPKTGRWIAYEVRLPDRTILNYRCSVCGRKLIGYSTETLSEAPYCHCGAKMVEPQERSGKE